MARLQLSCLGVLLLVALSGPASATSTQSLGDLASTGLPELAAAVVTEAQGTPLEPVVNGVVRTVGDALGLGASSLSAPSPAGAAIFNTNAGPAVAPAASSSATIFDTSAPPAVAPVTAPVRAPASAPLLAPAPAPAARAPAVNRAAVPVFASPNDAGAVGGRRLLRA